MAARFYDRYFTRANYRLLFRSKLLLDQAPHVQNTLAPRGLREFDNWYTAVVLGFQTADCFYADASSCHVISDIRIPTLFIAARDDPLVPAEIYDKLDAPASITLHLTEHGGHLGFIGSQGCDPDRRWLDWRILDWITAGRRLSNAA